MDVIYTYENAPGALVYDMDTGARLDRVVSVDLEAGVVTQTSLPIRAENGEVVTEQSVFDRIGVEFEVTPVHAPRKIKAFLCHGRKG